MLTERLQILVTPQQRSLLEREARRREVSVGQLVRDTVDSELGVRSRGERHAALDRLLALGATATATELTVEEMNEIVERDLAEDFERLHGSGGNQSEAPGRHQST